MKLYVFDDSGTFRKVENGGKPYAIALTVPVRFFEDYSGGLAQFQYIMGILEEAGMTWHNTISAKPKMDVDYCYLVYDGKVQLKLLILGFETGKSRTFIEEDIERFFPNKNWVNLIGPVDKAPRDYYMKGFQGFRYTDFIF